MDPHRELWSSKSTPQTPDKGLFDTDVKCVLVHLKKKCLHLISMTSSKITCSC